MKTFFRIIAISLLFFSCNTNNKEEGKKSEPLLEHRIALNDQQIKNAGIQMGKSEQRSISSILRVNGKIDVPPQNMVSISVPLGGFLRSTQLLPGMKVKKGEAIAVMEDQQYIQLQQDYLTSKTRGNFLQKEFERQKDLNQSKASSDKVLQQTEADYKSQKINEKALFEKLKLIHIDPDKLDENTISRSIIITAPIDGYVSKVNANIGKYINPADVLFELVNPNDIHLNLTVFEKDINKLFVGQKLLAFTNNEPREKHQCEILLIGQNLSPERNVEVHCHFDDYDNLLIPGMYMNAEIEIKTSDAIVLPEEAIVSHQGKNYVIIALSKNSFELKEIEIGITENGFTQIISPYLLNTGNIVVKGAYSILMSLKNKAEES